MKTNNQAFTLIELLVVVLIIGILAAVALPQYQIAVFKSRITQAIPFVKTLKEAQEIYYLANGEYTNHIENLDIDTGICPIGWKCSVNTTAVRAQWYENDKYILALVYSLNHRKDSLSRRAGKLYCYTKTTSQIGMRVCKTMGEEFSRSDSEILYVLN